jgi:hypothetical protein
MRHLFSIGLVSAAMVGIGAAGASAAPLSPPAVSLATENYAQKVQYELRYRDRNYGNRGGSSRYRGRNYGYRAPSYSYRGSVYGFAGERYADRVWSFDNFGGSYGYLGSYGYSHQYYGSRP